MRASGRGEAAGVREACVSPTLVPRLPTFATPARAEARHRLLLLPWVLRNFLKYRSTVHGFYKKKLNIGSPYMGFKDVLVLLAHPCMGFKGIS